VEHVFLFCGNARSSGFESRVTVVMLNGNVWAERETAGDTASGLLTNELSSVAVGISSCGLAQKGAASLSDGYRTSRLASRLHFKLWNAVVYLQSG
jgi:hypothetical protein